MLKKHKRFDFAAPSDTSRENSQPIMWRSPLEDEDSIELPLFDFNNILLATNNFDIENKLGQGGYGPVYRVSTSIFFFSKGKNVLLHQRK